jgi:hypothetical protein
LPRATGLAGGRTNELFIGRHSWFGLGDPKNKISGTNQHCDMQNENESFQRRVLRMSLNVSK